MKALISPNERAHLVDGTSGLRVAQTAQEAFEVAQPLFWVACPDDCVADFWYFDEAERVCKQKPLPPEGPVTPVEVLP